MRKVLIAAGLSCALAACGGPQEAPGGVTPDEAAALNDAAVMLDANSVSVDAVGNSEESE